jgi:hypothetical protein
MHWVGSEQWLWNPGMLAVGPNRGIMMNRLSRMMPGDMPDFEPGMVKAHVGLMSVRNASVRHLIIISDGDPSDCTNATLRRYRSSGIKITTVAVGAHGPAESSRLKNIADATGGKYYAVSNPNMLPRIYQKEARVVARPLVFERKEGITPRVVFPHEMLQGVESLPPITGFVRTSKKSTGLAEMSVASPIPDRLQDNPILASWTYGQGKSLVLTTDVGKRWATDWTAWAGYDKFFSQIVRWTMRASGEEGKFTVSTDVEDGKLKVVVTALTEEDEYLNFLNIAGTAVGPDMKPQDLELKQVAPGRYIGEVEAGQQGNYFVTLNPGQGKAALRAGASVPYSDEFRDRETNEGLLRSLAAQTPVGGEPGKVIEAPADVQDSAEKIDRMLTVDTFRHDLPKATASQDVWHYLVLLGSCLFFADVFVRRVSVSFAWLGPLATRAFDYVRARHPQPAAVPAIERLRGRKAEVAEAIEQRRAATRYEPTAADTAAAKAEQAQPSGSGLPKPAATPGGVAPSEQQAEEDTYTNRLLKAKQRVWEERKKEPE